MEPPTLQRGVEMKKHSLTPIELFHVVTRSGEAFLSPKLWTASGTVAPWDTVRTAEPSLPHDVWRVDRVLGIGHPFYTTSTMTKGLWL
jgi:hypothetical protein